MTLLLRQSEIEPLLDMRQAIAVIRRAYEADGAGLTAQIAPVSLPVGKNHLRLAVGGVLDIKRVAIRGGIASGGPGSTVMTLMDSETGELLSVMGYPFGHFRAGATCAVAADLMAPRSVTKIAIIGTGRNAPGLLEAVCCVRQPASISVFSRHEDHRRAFAARMTARLNLPCTPVNSARECIDGAEMILTATDAPLPVVEGESLAHSVHVNSMGRPSELDEAVYLRAGLIVVGNKDLEINYFNRGNVAQPLLDLRRSGRVVWDNVLELGQLAGGARPPLAGITVFRESQGGFGDAALGAWAYERAVERGLGQPFDFRGVDLLSPDTAQSG